MLKQRGFFGQYPCKIKDDGSRLHGHMKHIHLGHVEFFQVYQSVLQKRKAELMASTVATWKEKKCVRGATWYVIPFVPFIAFFSHFTIWGVSANWLEMLSQKAWKISPTWPPSESVVHQQRRCFPEHFSKALLTQELSTCTTHYIQHSCVYIHVFT